MSQRRSYESRIDARGLESAERSDRSWGRGNLPGTMERMESFVLHGDGWGSIEVGEYDGGWIPIPSASACAARNRARVYWVLSPGRAESPIASLEPREYRAGAFGLDGYWADHASTFRNSYTRKVCGGDLSV